MRTQCDLKVFMFQTENDEFNNKIAKLGGVLNNNCPESPDTMSIVNWFWRTIGEMATVTLLLCELTDKPDAVPSLRNCIETYRL